MATTTSLDNHPLSTTTTTTPHKRFKVSADDNHRHHHQSLLPGLPDHIAQLCLSLIPPSTLYSVCRSWRRLIYSPSFPPFLSLYTLSVPTTTTTTHQNHNQTIQFSSYDPISYKWVSVIPPPESPLSVCFRHPSFISRNLPIQSLSVSGNIVLLAATSDQLLPALPCPLIFNPLSKTWSSGPPLSTPRRWCAAGASGATVVIASGISSQYHQSVAQSVERWVLRKSESFDRKRKDSGWNWEKMRSLRDAKLCREAVDAVGWKGKLCMVNVKGNYAKEGVVYDLNSDEWTEMPEGMLGGWRGPAAAMDEETIYVVDESRGVLRKYDEVVDGWVDVLEDERLKGAESIVAGGGKVCVVSGGGVEISVVDVVSSPSRLWVLDPPAGCRVLGLHILPRMCPSEFHSPDEFW